MIISKVTKKQGFTLCRENIILENHRGGSDYPAAFLEVKNLGLSNENFISFKEVSLSVPDQ